MTMDTLRSAAQTILGFYEANNKASPIAHANGFYSSSEAWAWRELERAVKGYPAAPQASEPAAPAAGEAGQGERGWSAEDEQRLDAALGKYFPATPPADIVRDAQARAMDALHNQGWRRNAGWVESPVYGTESGECIRESTVRLIADAAIAASKGAQQ